MTNDYIDQKMLDTSRKTVPLRVAQSIIFAQPMLNANNIFRYLRHRSNSRGKQGVRPTPQQFNQFLRLNNRKRTQSHAEIEAAGYPTVFIDLPSGVDYEEVDAWLAAQIGQHKFMRINARYWFTNEQDAMLARMGWP